MIDVLLGAVVVGLVTFTVARTLVYSFFDEEANNGPLKSSTIFVQSTYTNETRPANLFDLIRQLFNMYTVERKGNAQIWRPKLSAALSAWACQHCLGFWIALIVTIFTIEGSLIHRLLVVFGAASVNTLLVRIEDIADGTQLREMQRQEIPGAPPSPESAETIT